MSIFNLHANVLDDYRDFVRSFFTVADDRAREFIERELVAEARLWPEALLQVSPSYARVASVDELADRGVILRETAQIFRTESGSPLEILELNERANTAAPQGQPFYLYQHQVEALERAGRRERVTSSPAARVRARVSLISCPSLMRSCATPPRPTASPRSWYIP
jgi:ATP-dependent helicase YprA (DUF1998 family)